MTGMIIITGANGSVALHTTERLLKSSPRYVLILTVRNDGDDDVNTQKLRELVNKHPEVQAQIRKLDLVDLESVHSFARGISADVSSGKLPPIASIICNAFYWNLARPLEYTGAGFEKTFQVNHISHVALVLPLLGSFDARGGRIILFASDAHEPGKNQLEKFPPAIPSRVDKLDTLVKPSEDPTVDHLGYGFRRYANSKLAIILWGYALNRRLEKDAHLKNITVIITNPGNISNSRALLTNTPAKLVFLSTFIVRPLGKFMCIIDPTMMTSATAGANIASLATNVAAKDERGYFIGVKKATSSQESNDEATQDALWCRSALWAGILASNCKLQISD